MNIQPLDDYILVLPQETENKTDKGIFLPETAKEETDKTPIGTIVSTGRECKLVAVGDLVIYEQYRGYEINIDNKTYIMLKESNILAMMK